MKGIPKTPAVGGKGRQLPKAITAASRSRRATAITKITAATKEIPIRGILKREEKISRVRTPSSSSVFVEFPFKVFDDHDEPPQFDSVSRQSQPQSAHNQDIRDVVSHLFNKMDTDQAGSTILPHPKTDQFEELSNDDIVDKVQKIWMKKKAKEKRSKQAIEQQLLKRIDPYITAKQEQPMSDQLRSNLEFDDLDDDMVVEKERQRANNQQELRSKAHALKSLAIANGTLLPEDDPMKTIPLPKYTIIQGDDHSKSKQKPGMRRSPEDEASADRKLDELLFQIMTGRDDDGKKWARLQNRKAPNGPLTKDERLKMWTEANEIMGLVESSSKSISSTGGSERVIRETKYREGSSSSRIMPLLRATKVGKKSLKIPSFDSKSKLYEAPNTTPLMEIFKSDNTVSKFQNQIQKKSSSTVKTAKSRESSKRNKPQSSKVRDGSSKISNKRK